MSNHFPAPPDAGDWNLISVTYTTSAVPDMPFSLFSGITGVSDPGDVIGDALLGYGPGGSEGAVPGLFGLAFVFETPGAAGSFDQDAVEGNIATVLNDIAEVIAAVNGSDLATAQASVTVSREWTWQGPEGYSGLTFGDTMAYPA